MALTFGEATGSVNYTGAREERSDYTVCRLEINAVCSQFLLTATAVYHFWGKIGYSTLSAKPRAPSPPLKIYCNILSLLAISEYD